MKCKHCESDQTVKDGKNGSGSQRYKCKKCGRQFTPEPNEIGYPLAVRQQGVEMYVDGQNYRRTGRNLRVNHQSIANWVKEAAQKALDAASTRAVPRPVVDEDTVVELDELFTFIGDKKNKIYVVTQVHRETRCFMSWLAITERTTEVMQSIVDDSPKVARNTPLRGVLRRAALLGAGPLHFSIARKVALRGLAALRGAGPWSDDLCRTGLSLRLASGG